MSSSRGKRQASPNDQSEENEDPSAWFDFSAWDDANVDNFDQSAHHSSEWSYQNENTVNYSIAETPQYENSVNDLTSVMIDGFHISDSDVQMPQPQPAEEQE
ncbi:hypothetical protein OROMI_003292 [Orobanche minor]